MNTREKAVKLAEEVHPQFLADTRRAILESASFGHRSFRFNGTQQVFKALQEEGFEGTWYGGCSFEVYW